VRKRSRKVRKTLSGVFTTIKPTSIYPSTYDKFPADQDDWGCQHWKVYYDRNKELGGEVYARELILTDSERVGWFADLHLCKYNCDWIDYFNKQGMPGGNIFSKLYCAGDNVADTVKETTSAVKNVGMFTRKVTGSPLLWVGIGLGGYYLANKYIFNAKGKR
jgi:hypothetical protein